jgi:hypothetical protein
VTLVTLCRTSQSCDHEADDPGPTVCSVTKQ